MVDTEVYYSQLQKRYSRRITLGLSRIKSALFKLNSPHLKLKNPINILGSDGKFSTLTSLKSFLEADKKSSSAFISPHLYDLRTRVWLKNRYISIKEIKKYEKIIRKLDIKLSLFEVLTLIFIINSANEDNDYNLQLVTICHF